MGELHWGISMRAPWPDDTVAPVRPPRLASWVVAVSSCVAFGLLSLHLGQDLNWDLKNYHYYNGCTNNYNHNIRGLWWHRKLPQD